MQEYINEIKEDAEKVIAKLATEMRDYLLVDGSLHNDDYVTGRQYRMYAQQLRYNAMTELERKLEN